MYWIFFELVFPWVVILIFSSLISVSCPTINKQISGFFRILGRWRSLWGSTSDISLLCIPFCLLYRNFHYLCYVLVLFVDLCYFLCAFVFSFLFLWFLWFWVRTTWFAFGSIFSWNVIFLFSPFHLMSVSLPTVYDRITSFFQVIREQVKCMKKYFFCKFHFNSPIPHRSLCVLCLGIIFCLYFCVIEYI